MEKHMEWFGILVLYHNKRDILLRGMGMTLSGTRCIYDFNITIHSLSIIRN